MTLTLFIAAIVLMALVWLHGSDWSKGASVLKQLVAAKAKVLPATSIQGVADQTATTPREGIFNLQGQRLRSLQHGINIVNGKKVLKR